MDVFPAAPAPMNIILLLLYLTSWPVFIASLIFFVSARFLTSSLSAEIEVNPSGKERLENTNKEY